MKEDKPNPLLEETLNTYFPKGDKDRGRALVLMATGETLIRQKKRDTIKKVIEIIDEIKNPYPKDVFVWDTKGKNIMTTGRFNKFCFSFWENLKNKVKEEILELEE